MPFDTAVFYDIENLLGGYGFTKKTAINLSLEAILKDVRATERLGDIAVQRAYANWSDPRLGFMREEIDSMGIDPVQVFGFNREHKKNAAAIQLAVDAIDLSYLRPAITVFVIVSGDGGFSALAKKLHEHGKTVVGCAYDGATNAVFKSVCDEFVSIGNPERDEAVPGIGGKPPEIKQGKPRAKAAVAAKATTAKATPAKAAAAPKAKVKAAAPNPKVDRAAAILKQLPPLPEGASTDVIMKQIQNALSLIAGGNDWRVDLVGSGLHVPNVHRIIQQLVPGLAPIRFGFRRVGEFLQFAATGTELCVARRQAASPPMMVLRSAVPAGWSVLPDLHERHSEIIYS